MSEPTEKEMLAFIHGIISGLGAAEAVRKLGIPQETIAQMLTEAEDELGIPHAVPRMHPCFKKLEKTNAWRKRIAWGN